MSHGNELEFVKRHVPLDSVTSVIEIGSRIGKNDWRRHFKGKQYTGVDFEPGEGVDFVADITKPIALKADFVLCCNVLEHVADPWAAARTITDMLDHGGTLYISTPWVWRYHPYPDDYWRFTYTAIRLLFPDISWTTQQYSTQAVGDFFDCGPDIDTSRALVAKGIKYLPYLQLHSIGRRV